MFTNLKAKKFYLKNLEFLQQGSLASTLLYLKEWPWNDKVLFRSGLGDKELQPITAFTQKWTQTTLWKSSSLETMFFNGTLFLPSCINTTVIVSITSKRKIGVNSQRNTNAWVTHCSVPRIEYRTMKEDGATQLSCNIGFGPVSEFRFFRVFR